MGRVMIIAAALAGLAGCGYSPDYVKPRIQRMSDQELMRAWVLANQDFNSVISPQDEWIFEEMQRRGMVRLSATTPGAAVER